MGAGVWTVFALALLCCVDGVQMGPRILDPVHGGYRSHAKPRHARLGVPAARQGLTLAADIHTRRALQTSTMAVTTVAGRAKGSADGTGANAEFYHPYGIALSVDKTFALITDTYNHRIRKLLVATNAVSTVAGGSAGLKDATGTSAKFFYPVAVVVSPDDSFALIADSNNHRIRKLVTKTNAVETLAGSDQGFADASGTSAKFDTPYGVAISADGSFALVADWLNHRIRKIVLSTKAVSTVAGSSQGFEDASGTSAKFFKVGGLPVALYCRLLLTCLPRQPADVAISPDDSFALIADGYNHRIRKLVLSTTAVSTLAGSSQGFVDATGTSAKFYRCTGRVRTFKAQNNHLSYNVSIVAHRPYGVAISAGASYALIVDTYNHRIRQIALNDNATVSTVVGGPGGFVDGVGTSAKFYYVSAISGSVVMYINFAALLGSATVVVDGSRMRLRSLLMTRLHWSRCAPTPLIAVQVDRLYRQFGSRLNFIIRGHAYRMKTIFESARLQAPT